ncbi:MAG: chemotaxis-specific protein-glutamate methyltransferase CheB [Steroidobacteraceae bacterium]|jgi:two-component system chemotaxis response regulator CheB
MKKLRVLVVEDSLTIRRRFCDILAADPELEVIGEADNGKLAIELCEQLRPDVITLDMVLPVMSGLTATEYIMAYVPTPILIVSASTNRGELFKTYDALAAGAVDVLEKPAVDDVDGTWERRFVAAVKLIATIKVITHLRARRSGTERAVAAGPGRRATSPTSNRPSQDETQHYGVVAIGASTGGPAAIVEVLRALPPGLRVPVFFVLHIDEPFATSFAEWLDNQTPHRVAYARDRDSLDSLRGHVIMAPPGRHLSVAGARLHLSSDPPRHSCRPSVDVLFESLAVDRGAEVVACLLTGMGRDGAAGLLAIRRAGGFTVAQDESTSVIYGMPREAVLLDAARIVLPLDQIGPQIVRLLGDGERRPA